MTNNLAKRCEICIKGSVAMVRASGRKKFLLEIFRHFAINDA